jgi:hypothetical protein
MCVRREIFAIETCEYLRNWRAVAESFFSSLKKERIEKEIYKNRELATTDVAAYIDTVYNRTRAIVILELQRP